MAPQMYHIDKVQEITLEWSGYILFNIVYFNINFTCNNNCVFCFSHNVGHMSREISLKKIIQSIDSISLSTNDIIVVNGGEPSLHSEFDTLLEYIMTLPCVCKIYTNGRRLNHIGNPLSNNICFIIPIHGNKMTHNFLARAEAAFEETTASLVYLNENKIQYSLKFIISKEMIQDKFDILKFIEHYQLVPHEIYLSRMNVTVKSDKNQYLVPSFDEEYEYLKNQFITLSKADYKIKFLDFPPCYFNYLYAEYHLMTTKGNNFFYNDYKHFMEKRIYKKNRLHTSECNNCKHADVCDFLSNTYYLFEYKGNSIVGLELE